MTASEKRYLRGFACMLCDQRLDKDVCGAIWTRCDAETRAKRRADCLAARPMNWAKKNKKNSKEQNETATKVVADRMACNRSCACAW
jgi:hypothetical protein